MLRLPKGLLYLAEPQKSIREKKKMILSADWKYLQKILPLGQNK